MKTKFLIFSIFTSSLALSLASYAYADSCPPGPQLQNFFALRQNLLREAKISYGAGDNRNYLEIVARMDLLDTQYPSLFLDQEIRNFPLFGSVPCLVEAMRRASGQNLNYQPRSDNKLNLFLDGQMIREGLSTTDLLSIAKSMR